MLKRDARRGAGSQCRDVIPVEQSEQVPSRVVVQLHRVAHAVTSSEMELLVADDPPLRHRSGGEADPAVREHEVGTTAGESVALGLVGVCRRERIDRAAHGDQTADVFVREHEGHRPAQRSVEFRPTKNSRNGSVLGLKPTSTSPLRSWAI